MKINSLTSKVTLVMAAVVIVFIIAVALVISSTVEGVISKNIEEEVVGKATVLNDDIENMKVGIDISGDTDCLKYVFSTELEEFKKNLKKVLPNAEMVNNNSKDFDVILTVKNRGYSSKVFKTLISVENKMDKSLKNYYISAEYNLKTWDINVSEPDQKPQDW